MNVSSKQQYLTMISKKKKSAKPVEMQVLILVRSCLVTLVHFVTSLGSSFHYLSIISQILAASRNNVWSRGRKC
jgi:hypothetical protein